MQVGLAMHASLCLAAAEPHWAFGAPQRPTLPEAAGNPVDHFVDRRLRRSEIEPAPRANKHTIVRRLSWDLRGLPPTPEEVADFAADDSPDAWSKLVERFLASPHFGERMAQDWFDLARFADTSGYAADRTRNVWPYREWVIDAINRNMPFDKFTIEQIAGDMLPGATQEQKLATGFHRQAMQAKGNNPRKEEFRVKTVVDRLKTTGRTWLGLSLECAECHDHKYDPISQRDYYQLFAIFNNVPHLGSGYGTHGPLMKFVPPSQSVDRERIAAEIAALSEQQSAFELRSDPKTLLGRWAGPTVIEDASAFSVTGDLTIAATINTTEKIATIASKNDWRGGQRSYLFGIGGEGDKNGVPGHLFAWISARTAPWDGVEIYGSAPVNDGETHQVAVAFKAGKTVQLIVDGVPDLGARVVGRIPGSIAKSARPLSIGASYNNSPKASAFPFVGTLKDVRLYSAAAGFSESPELAALRTKLAKAISKPIDVPVMEELPTPRETHVHLRGNFKQKGERVFPAVPKALPPFGGDSVDRLGFARWIVRPDQPLTARVAVNYLWQHFFGVGIVATPADFGTQGAPPTHPDLLDWLAVEFMESGWDRKHIIRLITNSKTYQRSSSTPHSALQTPHSYAFMLRNRLPAEQIRDHFLAVSGLLVPKIGGPSVFPMQPAGFYEERGQNEPGNSNFTWKVSPGEGRYRKSMYIYWKRMGLHPSMAALDAPPRQVCVAMRSSTNTPQQPLVTLNDPMFDECARAFAKRIESGGAKSDDERIRLAFQLCLSRDPDSEELAKFRAFVETDGWHAAAAVLLNLDEAMTRE